MLSRGFCLASLFSLPILCYAQAIDPSELRVSSASYWPVPPVAFHSDTNQVEVGVVVRDARGDSVRGLQQSDFAIFDGTRREIQSFSVVDDDLPARTESGAGRSPMIRQIVLLFDDYLADDNDRLKKAQVSGLLALKKASERFMKENPLPGDVVSVYSTSRGRIVPFTADIALIVSSIRSLNSTPRNSLFLETEVLAAFERVVSEVARLPGHRTILLAASGISAEMNASDLPSVYARERDVVSQAVAAGIVINAIDGKGLYTKLQNEDDLPVDLDSLPPRLRARMSGRVPQSSSLDLSNDPLATIAYGTGGTFFHNSNDLAKGIKQLVEPRIHYLLSFTSNATPDGQYHPLRVKLTLPNHYELDARPGYYARLPERDVSPARARLLEEAVFSEDTLADLPVALIAHSSMSQGGRGALVAQIHVDLQHSV